MKLPASLTVDSLEEEYTSWQTTPDKLLRLSTQFSSFIPFCVEATLLQVIASVSRNLNGELQVQFDGLSTERESYQNSLTNVLGNARNICAWLMASEIQDEAGKTIPKSESVVFNRYLDAMNEYEFDRTSSSHTHINLICVQGAQREFIQPLYHESNGRKVIRPYPEVRLFVQDILSQLANEWKAKQLQEVSGPLAQLARELMENADWWARTDVDGNLYPRGKGYRVLSFRLVNIDEDSAEKFAGSSNHVNSYLSSILLEQGKPDDGKSSTRGKSNKRHDFIELSIVDTGPGLARRWLSSQGDQSVKDLNKVDIETEQQAVFECFKKWATSSNNTLRGIGLFSVAKMLREKNGFMRLRTGRLSYLFGTRLAFNGVEEKIKAIPPTGEHQYTTLPDGTHVIHDGPDAEFFLHPWNKDDLSPVEGTSYSILLPV